MLTRNQINLALVAILATLAEVDSAPAGILYTALQARDAQVYTLEAWEMLRGILLAGGLVTESAHELSITAKGRQIAALAERVAS